MIHHTKGIVLRATKFGETSLIVTIFTELFGIQSYLSNGARTQGRSAKAHFFQPASILDMQVYQNPLKNLQRIKELKWNYIYKNVLSDVKKNSVALYMVELLHKCLKQPENNPALFEFAEHAFLTLDVAENVVTANFPIYFSLQVTPFLGFRIQDNFSESCPVLDLSEGIFIPQLPLHPNFIEGDQSYYISEFLKTMHPDEIDQIRLNKLTRVQLLLALQSYYNLHMPDFGLLKTLPVLQELLS